MYPKLRLYTLHQQGLTKARPFGKGIEATKRALEHLGYVQIDTISVIERAHHHTLWSRIPDYQPDYLERLVEERSVFEYWYHAASYLPMKDYRFVLPQMSAVKRGVFTYLANVENKYVDHVIDRIRIDGPLKARNFQSPTRSGSKWWNWKPTKLALEKLFFQGDLMVAGRDGMEKVYDLRERVLPEKINTTEPTLREFSEYLINTTVRAHGFTSLSQLTHLRPGIPLREALSTTLREKIDQGALVELEVDGSPTIYIDPELFEQKLSRPIKSVRLLSPFDNATIHRDRLKNIFRFDYKLECYTPKEKRKYGYFSLPVLYNDALIGRADCKAHRKKHEFEVISLYIESKNIVLDEFIGLFLKAVSKLAKFNNCHSVHITNVRPKKLTKMFKMALAVDA